MHHRPLLASRASRTAIGIAFALAVLAPAAGAQTFPSPDALAARHDSLIGGRSALEPLRSIRMIGTFSLAAAGIEAPLEILKLRPNKYVFRAALGPMGEVVQGYDGTTAWAVQPGQGPMLLTGPQAEGIAEQADFFGDLHDYSKYASTETVGEEQFAGQRTYKVKMTRANGDVVHEFFDVETGLSAGSSATVQGPMGPTETVSMVSDYKRFGGLLVATRFVQRLPQVEIVLNYVTVEFDQVSESDVALPEGVLALMPKTEPAMSHGDHAMHAAPVALDAELADHFKGIALTEAQTRQVIAIKTRVHAAMDSLKRAATDQNDPALKAALARHMEQEHAEFKALLTAEQRTVFDENMRAHHAAEERRP